MVETGGTMKTGETGDTAVLNETVETVGKHGGDRCVD